MGIFLFSIAFSPALVTSSLLSNGHRGFLPQELSGQFVKLTTQECVALYLHSPNTHLWCCAELKHRGGFTFTFTLVCYKTEGISVSGDRSDVISRVITETLPGRWWSSSQQTSLVFKMCSSEVKHTIPHGLTSLSLSFPSLSVFLKVPFYGNIIH
jgi:hypothetical protein